MAAGYLKRTFHAFPFLPSTRATALAFALGLVAYRLTQCSPALFERESHCRRLACHCDNGNGLDARAHFEAARCFQLVASSLELKILLLNATQDRHLCGRL